MSGLGDPPGAAAAPEIPDQAAPLGVVGRAAGPGGAAPAETAIEWTFNPWRERPPAAALALALVLGCFVLLATLSVPALGSVALALAVASSVAPLLLPSRCRVDEDGVAHRRAFGWERRRWADIRRAARVRGGILVSPFEHPGRLDAFRALLLPLPRRDGTALAAQIAPRLARHGLAGR